MSKGQGSGKSRPPLAWADDESTQVVTRAEMLRDGAAGAAAQAYLVVLSGENVGEMFRLDNDALVLGRSPDAQVRLGDQGVSRRHARVVREGDTVFVEDLGSANGTLVNDAFVKRHALQHGDKIRLGATTVLKFTFPDRVDERFQQHMFEAALRDGLTRAYNKRFLLGRLDTEYAFARRHGLPLALIMLDVDHFKRLNDTHGHVTGDAVLAHMARLVQTTLRTEDVFARYGGEEFTVVCRATSLADGAVLAERIRTLVETTPAKVGDASVGVTVSAGLACVLDSGAQNTTQLIAYADEALYEAKRGGRNRVCVYRRAQ